MKVVIYFIVFLLIPCIGFAAYSESGSDSEQKNSEGLLKILVSLEDKIDLINKEVDKSRINISENNAEKPMDIKELKADLIIIERKFESLNNLVKEKDSSISWAGLMIGLATLILTGVSVFVAILAIWGFRNIRDVAIKEAVTRSEVVVKDNIESGDFDEVVNKAVEKAIYRNILSVDDFDENLESSSEER